MGGGGASDPHSLPACDHIWTEGCCWRRAGVNNRPGVIKGGVSVLRLNEQADKLCGGFRGGGAVGAVGADAVVFGTLDSVALEDSNQSDVSLSWSCVALSWSAGWQKRANASACWCRPMEPRTPLKKVRFKVGRQMSGGKSSTLRVSTSKCGDL